MEKFTITFTGDKAKELADRFLGYFWDGGLDQTIEQGFLEEYGLSLDDVESNGNNEAVINTDNATL